MIFNVRMTERPVRHREGTLSIFQHSEPGAPGVRLALPNIPSSQAKNNHFAGFAYSSTSMVSRSPVPVKDQSIGDVTGE